MAKIHDLGIGGDSKLQLGNSPLLYHNAPNRGVLQPYPPNLPLHVLTVKRRAGKRKQVAIMNTLLFPTRTYFWLFEAGGFNRIYYCNMANGISSRSISRNFRTLSTILV